MLEELIKLLGCSAAYNLCLHHGGERIYFAERKVPDIPCISQEQHQKLYARFRGDILDVPFAKPEIAHWMRNDLGKPISHISQALRVSRATVRRYLAQQQPAMPSLFDQAVQ